MTLNSKQCATCDLNKPSYSGGQMCQCVSEYIRYGTGCPIEEAEKRAEYKDACRERLEHCLKCDTICDYNGKYVFGKSGCPLRYNP